MSVVLCANRLRDEEEMEEALVHELVHVYDVSFPDHCYPFYICICCRSQDHCL